MTLLSLPYHCRTLSFFLMMAAVLAVSLTGEAWSDTRQAVFVVHGVDVDVTAKTAARARDMAIEQGQRKALKILFHKIVRTGDLPQIPTLENYLVNDLVSGLEFNNEKSSSVRYLASLTVSFDKDGIYNLLHRLEIPYSETPAKPALVLPVLQYGGTTILWSDQNWWVQAWDAADTANRLVEFRIPTGDFSDRLAVSAAQAVKADGSGLEKIAEKYNVDEVIVATANVTQDFTTGVYQVHVDTFKWPGNTATTSFDQLGQPGGTLEDVLVQSANDLVDKIADAWKRQTLIYFGDIRQLAVKVPLRQLDDWLKIRQRLGNVGAIRKILIGGLSVSEADLSLDYSGEIAQLKLALAQANLDLIQQDGGWTLTLATSDGMPGAATRQ